MSKAETRGEDLENRITDRVKGMGKKTEEILENGAHHLGKAIDSAADRLEELQANAQSKAGDVADSAQDMYERVLAEGRRQSARLEKDIKRAPLTSIGLAFLGGVVLATLLKRS
jgi:ElaB/YqjD/DUF883 family membrane-anchored ribosome-binding protein